MRAKPDVYVASHLCAQQKQNAEPNAAADHLIAAATAEVWLTATADAVRQRDCGNELGSVAWHNERFAFAKHAVRFIVNAFRQGVRVAGVKYSFHPACKCSCTVAAMLVDHCLIPRFFPPLKVVPLNSR